MAVTYNWLVEQMEAYPEKDSYQNVVFSCHWRCNANEGNFYATSYGTVGVTLDADAPFTPYEELTKEQVVGWVKDALGEEQVSQMETGLAGEIANLQNPPVVRPPLPWAAE